MDENNGAIAEAPEINEIPAPENNEVEVTSRNAIDRAFDAIDNQHGENDDDSAGNESDTQNKSGDKPQPKGDDENQGENEKPKAEAKNEKTEDDADKKSTDSSAFSAAPQRFSADAKAAWNDAPLPVRAEIDRAIKELENGISQYQERYKPIEKFEKMAQDNNVNLADQMQRYVDIDTLLQKDFLSGLSEICKTANVTIEQVAAHVLQNKGQNPNPQQQNTAQENAEIAALKEVVQDLRQQLTGVTTSIKNTQEADIQKQIDDFALENPRFDELQDDIALFIETGKAATLQEAYELAERLNPAPAQPNANEDPQNEQAEQTRKPQLSMAGTPAKGSNPNKRKKSASTRESIDSAFDSVGL